MVAQSTARRRSYQEGDRIPLNFNSCLLQSCSRTKRTSVVATAFLFCVEPAEVIAYSRHDTDSDESDEDHGIDAIKTTVPVVSPHRDLASALGLPALSNRDSLISAAALLTPGALAAHNGMLLPASGVVTAVFPMAVPFSVPLVSPDSWLANKRARAFHRCVVVCVYVQGALALFQFARGDLVGGTYAALQTAMGAYAIMPEGVRFFPTYIMMSGFNGILGTFQVFQQFQGVPIHFIPMLACLPPVLGITAAYCGWQFVKELQAIAAGLPGDGAQDSCFVRVMGGDWWPASSAPTSADSGGGFASLSGGGGRASSGFAPFGGGGQRLGEN